MNWLLMYLSLLESILLQCRGWRTAWIKPIATFVSLLSLFSTRLK